MMNYQKRLVLLLCLCLLAAIFAGCTGGEGKPTEPTTQATQPQADQILLCTVKVQNEAGTPLENVMVDVYTDETKSDIVQHMATDAQGQISFKRKGSVEGFVAVITGASVGYEIDSHYPLTGEDTVITLKAGAPLTEEHLNYDGNNPLLSYSDAMVDFSVTASDGTACTLSELLETHDAVVLNFWYMGCSPCKMEFPHLQEAYEQFSDRVAVLALNPMDSDNEQIEAFRQENGYTFLMAKCDSWWGTNLLKLTSYPVTLVIDRYGNIAMIHRDAVYETQTFLDIFGFYCAEDYEQTFIRSHSQLPTYKPNT